MIAAPGLLALHDAGRYVSASRFSLLTIIEPGKRAMEGRLHRRFCRWWGDRVDLVCGVGAPNEVFATLHGHQIAVGPTKGHHDDFEDFGRGLSDEAVAREAFDRLVEVLAEAGYLEGQ